MECWLLCISRGLYIYISSDREFDKRIVKGRKVIGMLNPFLCNAKIIVSTKRKKYKYCSIWLRNPNFQEETDGEMIGYGDGFLKESQDWRKFLMRQSGK